jgi:hypothetical protein
MECVAGCKAFDGGERKHHKDCPHYPESLSKISDDHKEALERLALPLAFHIARTASPEEQARMVFAQAILDGDGLFNAEIKAQNRAKDVWSRQVQRSLISDNLT